MTGVSYTLPRLVLMECQVVENQLWSLAMLVREQDQEEYRQPLPLSRCDRLRRTLDVRIYELLLLHVRTRMIWDGVDGNSHNRNSELNENSLEFRSGGGIHHQDSTVTPSGWDWLASA